MPVKIAWGAVATAVAGAVVLGLGSALASEFRSHAHVEMVRAVQSDIDRVEVEAKARDLNARGKLDAHTREAHLEFLDQARFRGQVSAHLKLPIGG